MRLPRSNVTLGLVALGVIAVLVYLGVTKAIPFQSHYELRASFVISNNIRPGSPVRIAGLQVGKVTGIERAHEGVGEGEAAAGDDGEAGSGAVGDLELRQAPAAESPQT